MASRVSHSFVEIVITATLLTLSLGLIQALNSRSLPAHTNRVETITLPAMPRA